MEFLLCALGDFHDGDGSGRSSFGQADALGEEFLAGDVTVGDVFFIADQGDVSEQLGWVHVLGEDDELGRTALGGFGHLVASFLDATVFVQVDHLVNLVR